MSAKKVGTLIKDARTNAGLSQAKLADEIPGLSASDISKAERGEKELTTDQLKAIAKATGVTQKSLLDAAKGTSTSNKKTGSSKPSSGSTSGKTTGTSMKLTATEKKLVELYREADTETKRSVMKMLKAEENVGAELLTTLIGGALETFLKKDQK